MEDYIRMIIKACKIHDPSFHSNIFFLLRDVQEEVNLGKCKLIEMNEVGTPAALTASGIDFFGGRKMTHSR